MITYLSSLYDVFPEPPQMHPLFDMDSQRRVQEYREMSQQFFYFCKEKTSLLQERTFSTTLIELKRLLSDLNKFRTEEIPPKQREKQRLFTTFKELEVSFLSFALPLFLATLNFLFLPLVLLNLFLFSLCKFLYLCQSLSK